MGDPEAMKKAMEDAFYEEYVAFTGTTAVYPDAGHKTPLARRYALAGLINELGEISGKYKKLLRDGWMDIDNYIPDPKSGQPFRSALAAEIGDVTYYVARVVQEYGFDLFEVFAKPAGDEWLEGEGLTEPAIFSFIAVSTQTMGCFVSAVTAVNRAVGGSVAAGTVDWLTDLVNQLRALAARLGSPLEYLMKENRAKLESRKARGVIKGSGDNR